MAWSDIAVPNTVLIACQQWQVHLGREMCLCCNYLMNIGSQVILWYVRVTNNLRKNLNIKNKKKSFSLSQTCGILDAHAHQNAILARISFIFYIKLFIGYTKIILCKTTLHDKITHVNFQYPSSVH